jgi:predicted phage tail protein
LQQSIDALKAIVDKDNEILEELANRQSKDRSEFTDKYNDLIQQNNDLTQKNSQLMELNQRTEGFSKENHLILEDAQQREFLFIAIAGFMGILFLVYLTKYSMLKNKVKSQQNGANYPSES